MRRCKTSRGSTPSRTWLSTHLIRPEELRDMKSFEEKWRMTKRPTQKIANEAQSGVRNQGNHYVGMSYTHPPRQDVNSFDIDIAYHLVPEVWTSVFVIPRQLQKRLQKVVLCPSLQPTDLFHRRIPNRSRCFRMSHYLRHPSDAVSPDCLLEFVLTALSLSSSLYKLFSLASNKIRESSYSLKTWNKAVLQWNVRFFFFWRICQSRPPFYFSAARKRIRWQELHVYFTFTSTCTLAYTRTCTWARRAGLGRDYGTQSGFEHSCRSWVRARVGKIKTTRSWPLRLSCGYDRPFLTLGLLKWTNTESDFL